jgi:hypothetical protein
MPGPPPIAQVRIIASSNDAAALLARLTAHARTLYGPHAAYRTHTRAARRHGHVRVYLTITRTEVNAGDTDSQDWRSVIEPPHDH